MQCGCKNVFIFKFLNTHTHTLKYICTKSILYILAFVRLENMNGIHKNLVFGIISVGILLAMFSECGEGRPSYVDVDNVYETLRYLEELDRLYSQKARPRFGRSVDKYQNVFPKFSNGKNDMNPSVRR